MSARGVNDALEFAFRRQFDLKAPQPPAGRIKQGVRGVRRFRTLVAKPVFQLLLVLRRRKMPSEHPHLVLVLERIATFPVK